MSDGRQLQKLHSVRQAPPRTWLKTPQRVKLVQFGQKMHVWSVGSVLAAGIQCDVALPRSMRVPFCPILPELSHPGPARTAYSARGIKLCRPEGDIGRYGHDSSIVSTPRQHAAVRYPHSPARHPEDASAHPGVALPDADSSVIPPPTAAYSRFPDAAGTPRRRRGGEKCFTLEQS